MRPADVRVLCWRVRGDIEVRAWCADHPREFGAPLGHTQGEEAPIERLPSSLTSQEPRRPPRSRPRFPQRIEGFPRHLGV